MPRQRTVSIPLGELTDRQLHLHLIGLLDRQVAVLTSLEHHMADLTTAVTDLQAAVDGINSRIAGQVADLQSQIDAGKSALADMTALDEADKAALQAALDGAQTAADSIEGQVDELNAIGAAPETPVEPAPADGTGDAGPGDVTTDPSTASDPTA
jgi:peptidoglycan hydrolase CwlO-like protein